MSARAWIDWPDAPGFWWAHGHGDEEPSMALAMDSDGTIDVHVFEGPFWLFCGDNLARRFRFLPTGLVRPTAPSRSP